jgi:hypothetical protein
MAVPITGSVAGRGRPYPPIAETAADLITAPRLFSARPGGSPLTVERRTDALASALGIAPRCAYDTLAAQAAAWAAHARRAGARFDVEAKAMQAAVFSARHTLDGLCIPTKAVGVSAYPDGLLALRAALGAAGRFLPLLPAPDAEGIHLFRTDRLRSVQHKHLGWIRSLPPMRYAATVVTGGTAERPTMGLNFLIEVHPVLDTPPAGAGAVEGEPTDAQIDARAAEHAADRAARHLYGEGPAPSPAAGLWERMGGWAQ